MVLGQVPKGGLRAFVRVRACVRVCVCVCVCVCVERVLGYLNSSPKSLVALKFWELLSVSFGAPEIH